jgi:predicted Zn-ribbon and HTH transcriptional regulator
MARVEVWAWKCERCEHVWLPREKDKKPLVCPKCKSPYWDTPRKVKVQPNQGAIE